MAATKFERCSNNATEEELGRAVAQSLLLRTANRTPGGVSGNYKIHPLLNTDTMLHVPLTVVVMVDPDNPLTRIPVSQVQENLRITNLVMNSRYDPSRLPTNSKRYKHADLLSNPRVRLLPSDHKKLTEERGNLIYLAPYRRGSVFRTAGDCEREFERQGHTLEKGRIYTFIGTLTGREGYKLLGIAKSLGFDGRIPSLALNHETIGSYSSVGAGGTTFGIGLTWAHELGHLLGLHHPFPINNGTTDELCNGESMQHIQSLYPDLPRQAYSNLETSIEDARELDNGLDNRGRDYLRFIKNDPSGLKKGDGVNAPRYSCLTDEELADEDTLFEIFYDIMDYGDDNTMIGMTPYQVLRLRAMLLDNAEVYGIEDRLGNKIASVGPNSTIRFVALGVVVFLVLIFIITVYMYFRTKNGGVVGDALRGVGFKASHSFVTAKP